MPTIFLHPIMRVLLSGSKLWFLPHLTPASSECQQLFSPHGLWGQSQRSSSSPVHSKSSRTISSVPSPKNAPPIASPPLKPIMRHATSASALSNRSSQTVPHPLEYRFTSTRPSVITSPPTRRTGKTQKTQLKTEHSRLRCPQHTTQAYTKFINLRLKWYIYIHIYIYMYIYIYTCLNALATSVR